PVAVITSAPLAVSRRHKTNQAFEESFPMAVASTRVDHLTAGPDASFYEKLNSQWHKRSLQFFMIIVLGHWAEHLTQAVQIYILGWPRPKAGGVLGVFFPWLVRSEALHYGYALVMLVFL